MLRIRNVYPGSNNSNKGGGEKFVVLPFFLATNFTEQQIILFLNMYRKKIVPILFTQTIVTKLSKI
jgi:hypothetical protein